MNMSNMTPVVDLDDKERVVIGVVLILSFILYDSRDGKTSVRFSQFVSRVSNLTWVSKNKQQKCKDTKELCDNDLCLVLCCNSQLYRELSCI